MVVDGECNTITDIMIFLYSGEYSAYQEGLPLGFNPGISREEARSWLGSPSKQGGPLAGILDRSIIHWDRWDFESFSLHFEYPDSQDRVRQLTISAIQTDSP